MKKMVRHTLLASGLLVGATLLPAAPAAAANQLSCAIPDGAYGCSTWYVDHSSRITIRVLGATTGPVTCRAYDPGGNQRGSVTNYSSTVLKAQAFTVPYNRHFLSCVRSSTSGGGHGQLYSF